MDALTWEKMFGICYGRVEIIVNLLNRQVLFCVRQVKKALGITFDEGSSIGWRKSLQDMFGIIYIISNDIKGIGNHVLYSTQFSRNEDTRHNKIYFNTSWVRATINTVPFKRISIKHLFKSTNFLIFYTIASRDFSNNWQILYLQHCI